MIWHYLILGLVQGLTEFLPVSSSGHLVLTHTIFHFQEIDPVFDVFVQGGTVISVLFYFRHKLFNFSKQYLSYLFLATLPAGIIGLLLKDFVNHIFSSLWGVTLGFSLTTILLLFSRRQQTSFQKLTYRSALIIGLAQSLAILPGLSRSGSTITASLLLGISPLQAFDFSFLLSIPTIAGATLISLTSLTLDFTHILYYLLGFFTATIVGYFSLIFLAKLVKQGKFYKFAPYTAILTLVSLYLTLVLNGSA